MRKLLLLSNLGILSSPSPPPPASSNREMRERHRRSGQKESLGIGGKTAGGGSYYRRSEKDTIALYRFCQETGTVKLSQEESSVLDYPTDFFEKEAPLRLSLTFWRSLLFSCP